ncbi:chorismate mutase [Meridianimarinicoccus aquatilis]|uniref:chorismate mutase n=1 Tax=Meridianimarinicoccus aquatilis TaxID=2552766 RepID=A0A4R6AVZ0_9RHOB|nr:chorismate mutase [Fluviibacterium aquatile]QIE40651.1 chorismate mutase [Rhodobacteraceae bacterium SC52]TDL87902.1 chorismate mutase [Fluviibacterium aquatile]
MTTPEDCATMSDLRDLIDRIDKDIVGLLALRQDCIDRAAVLKVSEGLPARIPSRVEDVVSRVRKAAVAQGADPDLTEALWRQMIEWSISREEVALGQSTKGIT